MINIIGKKYIWIIFSDFFNFFLFKKFIPKPISCQYRFHYFNDVICCFVSWLRLVWDTKDFVWSKSQRSLKLDLHETEISCRSLHLQHDFHIQCSLIFATETYLFYNLGVHIKFSNLEEYLIIGFQWKMWKV